MTTTYELLEATLGRERLAAYLAEADGSKDLATALYVWNGELGAALWHLIRYIEVAARNAIAKELDVICRTDRPRAAWYNHPSWWSTWQRKQLADAKKNASRKPPIIAGRVIEQLSFGFWVSVLEIEDQTLWVPGLHRAFPNSPGLRKAVHGQLRAVNEVRNDIAHHSRLTNRIKNPIQLEENLLRAAHWINPSLADWLATSSEVRAVMARRPMQAPSRRWAPPAASPGP